MKRFFNKSSGEVVMAPDPKGLGSAIAAGVGSNITQPVGISYFFQSTFFLDVLESVVILGRNSLLNLFTS